MEERINSGSEKELFRGCGLDRRVRVGAVPARRAIRNLRHSLERVASGELVAAALLFGIGIVVYDYCEHQIHCVRDGVLYQCSFAACGIIMQYTKYFIKKPSLFEAQQAG